MLHDLWERRVVRAAGTCWPTAATSVLLVVVAFAGGGYDATPRALLGVSLWWIIGVGAVSGVLTWRALPRSARVTIVSFGAFAGWTLASTAWAPNPETSVEEFNRLSIYLAVLVVAASLASGRKADRVLDGIAIGIGLIAVGAVASRFFPHLFPEHDIAKALPSAATRLSFPLGYWNGLAVFAGLAVPLCLRLGLVGRSSATRAAAVALVPVLSAVIYLASSRGGIVAALAGTVVFVLACARRTAAAGLACCAALGSVLSLLLLSRREALVNGPLATHAAEMQGRGAAVMLLACCALTSAMVIGGERLVAPRLRPTRRHERIVLGVTSALIALAVVASHPVRRFEAFKQPLGAGQLGPTNFTSAHLLSGNGSGRWQFWSSAISQFESAPFSGGGAGSFRYWWAEHASFTYSLKNAHSLYLETLGELGLVGGALLGGALLMGIIGGARRLRHGSDRTTAAAVLAVFAAFLGAAAIDWIWQVPVVAIVGVACLGLLAGGGLDRQEAADATQTETGTLSRRLGVLRVVGVLAVTLAVIAAQVMPWITSSLIQQSQAAVRGGSLPRARELALDAQAIEPWAASPRLQVALVAEQQGDLGAAEQAAMSAAARDSNDWAVWYVAARIAREAGHSVAARRYLSRASALNPRSPIFAQADLTGR